MTTRQVGDVTGYRRDGANHIGDEQYPGTRSGSMPDTKKPLLNLAEVSYIDSSGIGEMVSGFTSQQPVWQVKLLNLTVGAKDLCKITAPYTASEVHDDEAAAVRSFT